MPTPSIGLIVLLIIIVAGIFFLLWVLYHFTLESKPRSPQRPSDWPTASTKEDRSRCSGNERCSR